ncbi:rhamnulokinase [Mitsuokella jalaludinii]|uniref:rhamnulokinase n=2 Tax=Mitsuokella jalaludinii TaxID=187979 RepID=UPI001D026646|nr:rhamnulokinase [Mitsuokella jalaludinii]MCB5724906.1 rhamnulokinase [Mitsuokella jalaludinii]
MSGITYYLAVDIGASSGRHILGWMDKGKIRMEEIYRFENKLEKRNGHLCWDLDHLFHEVVEGLHKCKELDRIPASVGIDTWGVDFVLLDAHGNVLGNTVAYRDGRTKGMDEEVYKVISESELYGRNGIQKQLFNSIYQLMAIKKETPQLLERAERFLMIPEYLNYRLTGVAMNEYTNATTTQLVNAKTQDWDFELMEMLGLPTKIFGELNMPKTLVGPLSSNMAKRVGFQTNVVLPATHDTGSAVMAVPTNSDDSIYLSSGTWSLMGIERLIPDCTEMSRKHNFTNEGGYHHRYRYLKNIMGMWVMQNLRREFKHKYTFEELYELAHIGRYFTSIVDVNDDTFLAPESMIRALQDYCEQTGQEKPETECELLYCVYRSLAKCYAKTVAEIETVTGRTYDTIHVVGGGCQDKFLDRLLVEVTGKEVYAGPVEATAIGNIMAQMLRDDVFEDLKEARRVVAKSFEVKRIADEMDE